MGYWDKEAQNAITMAMEVVIMVVDRVAKTFGSLIWNMVKHGNRKMFKFRHVIIMGALAIPGLVNHWLFLLPLTYIPILSIVESIKGGRFKKYFKKINFTNKAGVYPFCIGIRELKQDNKIKYIFASDIPLSIWESKVKDIEQAFETRITGLRKLKGNTIEMCIVLESNPKFREIENALKRIRFSSRIGILPICIAVEEDEKTTMYKFESSIPMNEWKNMKSAIEHELNFKIFHIESLKNRITALHTTNENLPEKIELQPEHLENIENGVFKLGVSFLKEIVIDLDNIPHWVISGETGSGKTNDLRVALLQGLLQGMSVKCVDFKGSDYQDFCEHVRIITEKKDFVNLLNDAIAEHKRRIELFRKVKAKKLSEYNEMTGENLERIIIIMDELTQVTWVKDKHQRPIIEKIGMLAMIARSTGIHLIIGMQRPDADALPGQIKTNVPGRIGGVYVDDAPYKILYGYIPEKISGKGRMYMLENGECIEFQSYLLNNGLVNRVLRQLAIPKRPQKVVNIKKTYEEFDSTDDAQTENTQNENKQNESTKRINVKTLGKTDETGGEDKC